MAILTIKAIKDGVLNAFVTRDAKLGVSGSLTPYRSINFGSSTSFFNDASAGRNLVCGVTQSATEGSPSTPCLAVQLPNTFYSFRWFTKTGIRTISALVKQNTTSSLATMVVKANTAIGLNTDQTLTAPTGSGWQLLGPLTFAALADGVVNVQLWNNNSASVNTTAFFDHLVIT